MRLRTILALALLGVVAVLWWPLSATAGPNAQPSIPHPLAGRSACTSCHQAGGSGAGAPGGTGMPANHQGRSEAGCVSCHQAAPASPAPAKGAPAASQPVSGPPEAPHTLEGRSACSNCHRVAGQGVGAPLGTGMPTSHQGRADATCVGCHQGAQTAPAAAKPGAQPSPPAGQAAAAPSAGQAEAASVGPAPAQPVSAAAPAPAAAPVLQSPSKASLPNAGEMEDRLALVTAVVVGGGGLLFLGFGLRKLIGGSN